MVKYIVAALAACLLCVTANAAPPAHHAHPGYVHPGYNPGYRPVYPVRPAVVVNVHHYGYAYRGVTYNNICYRSTWNGWSARQWHVTYGYIYYCPVQFCWYYYDGFVYIPCR
jgi:hypothetical protein